MKGGGTERLRIAGLQSALAGPFDLTLAAGECVAISGASGSGKTLFLRLVADLDPGVGTVALDGRDRRQFSAPEWRRRAVYCAAEPAWWHERVDAHFPGATLGFAAETAPRLGLHPRLLDSPVTQLSSGERQRLGLIRALALQPPVLLLDEPTGALDPDATSLVESLLAQRMATGMSMVLVTHMAAQAARLAHRFAVMRNRRFDLM